MDYARSPTAKGLLGTAGDATGDPQRRSFELLVAAGVFGADEPLELHRAGIVRRPPGGCCIGGRGHTPL